MASSTILETPDDGDYENGEGRDDIDIACFPIHLIEEDGIQPQEGDDTEFTAHGVVSKVKGEYVWVKLHEVNGEPVSGGSPGIGPDHETNEEGEDEDEPRGLRDMLSARDRELSGGKY